MRTIISLILTFYVTLTYSQVIDWGNFDTKLIDSLVIKEANIFRNTYSDIPLNVSPILQERVSIRQTNILVSKQKAFHPNVYHIFEEIKDSLVRESETNNPGKKNPVGAMHLSEICLKTYRQDTKFTTYEELAQHLIKLWKSSRAHHNILLHWGTYGDGVYTLAGVSVQVGNYYWGGDTHTGIYASLHICSTYLK